MKNYFLFNKIFLLLTTISLLNAEIITKIDNNNFSYESIINEIETETIKIMNKNNNIIKNINTEFDINTFLNFDYSIDKKNYLAININNNNFKIKKDFDLNLFNNNYKYLKYQNNNNFIEYIQIDDNTVIKKEYFYITKNIKNIIKKEYIENFNFNLIINELNQDFTFFEIKKFKKDKNLKINYNIKYNNKIYIN